MMKLAQLDMFATYLFLFLATLFPHSAHQEEESKYFLKRTISHHRALQSADTVILPTLKPEWLLPVLPSPSTSKQLGIKV